MRARNWRILLPLVVMLMARSGWAQTSIQYNYDELGRLIAVIDPGGDTAVYHYDAVGNVLSIDRYDSTDVSIISFSPGSGPVGTTVTIHGTGFSTTPSSNTVTFNSTGATVTTATATQLVVTVPSGATTGSIAVTAPGGSDTSASDFTVLSTSTLAISSFSPTAGVADTALTITGTGFDPQASNDRTRLNATFVGISAASTTELTTTVPPNAGSGHITVSTPGGTAVSTGDFIVPPSPYTPSDVAVSGRIPFETATQVTVSTANKIGLMLFDGTTGQRVSLLGTNGAVGNIFGCDINTSMLTPYNHVLAAPTCMEWDGFIDVQTLTTTGTYAVMVDPSSTVTGSVTLTLFDVPADVTGTITPGGSSTTVTISKPGQNGALTFAGTADQKISLGGTNGTIYGQIAGCDVNVGFVNPEGGVLAASTCMEGSGFIDTKTLPASGTYTVAIDPFVTATGNLTLTLYSFSDISGTITPGGSSQTVTIAYPGQNGALTFSGTTGDRIALQGTNGTIFGQIIGCDVNVSILKPDSSVLAAAACMEGTGFIDTLTLPATGTYTIVIDPVSTATGALTLTLHSVPADTSDSITAGGSSVTVTTTAPGQNGTLTFSGTANQRISLEGTNGMNGQIAFACDVFVRVLKPDSSVLVGSTCMETSGFIDVTTLPTTGTYTIVVDPADIAVGSLTLALYDVPANATTTLTVGGGSATLTTTVPGQNAEATFSGTASQQVTVHLTSNSMGSTTVNLLKPDGSQLTSTTSSASSFNLATQTLPTTGTYKVTVDPAGTNVGSMTVEVTSP